MMMELRFLASPDEIQVIEITCSRKGCIGVIRIDLKPNCLRTEQTCPQCEKWLWNQHGGKSPTYELLLAMIRYRNEKIANAPIMKMVLDGEKVKEIL